MFIRIIRIAAVSGVLAASSYAVGDNDELNRALACAEERSQAAPLAEPAYPAPAPARSYHYVGTGRSDNVRISPVTLAQAQTAPAQDYPAEGATPAAVQADKEYEAPVFSIKEDLKNTPHWLWEDTKRVYSNPMNLALLLTAGGASIAVHQHVDWTIADKFDRSRTCKEAWGDASNVIGHPVLHLGIAGAWYLAGYEFKDVKTYNVGKNMLSALIITDMSTVALKLAAADTEAPNGEHYAWPSGHTSSSFAIASVLHEAYGPIVGVPLYAVASWVGFERLDDRQHLFSDVIFGGMLGLVVGHSVASGHLPQIAGGAVLPYADPVDGTAGLAWLKSTK